MDGQAKKIGQKVKQALADESMEVLNSAKTQVTGEKSSNDNTVRKQRSDQGNGGISSEEEAKMKVWERRRMQELKEELREEENKRPKEMGEWKKEQERLMSEGKNEEEERAKKFVVPSSPKKKPMTRVEKKQRKTEMGRGPSG